MTADNFHPRLKRCVVESAGHLTHPAAEISRESPPHQDTSDAKATMVRSGTDKFVEGNRFARRDEDMVKALGGKVNVMAPIPLADFKESRRFPDNAINSSDILRRHLRAFHLHHEGQLIPLTTGNEMAPPLQSRRNIQPIPIL